MIFSELVVHDQVVCELFERVHLDLALFEQRVQVPAGGEAEQGTELVFGEAALAEGFEAPGFEGGAGQDR